MRAVWLAGVVAAGCAEPAVEMQLAMPASVPADFDLSCIGAVDVLGFSQAMLDEAPPDISDHVGFNNEQPACVNVSHATTFAELTDQLRGHVSVPLPVGGRTAIELRGRTGTCEQFPAGEGLIYGGGTYTSGASNVAVALAANISCKATSTLRVQPIDMLALIADAAHACKPLADVADGDAMLPAVIRPTRLTTKTSGPDLMMLELGSDFQPLGTDGTATLASFTAAAPDACIAVARESQTLQGSACVNRGVPTLCAADASTVELPVASSTKVEAAYDGALIAQYGLPVLGFAWERTATGKTPLAGATVTLTDPSRGTVVYLDIVNGNLQPAIATKTTAAGAFFVYTNGISAISVAAPSHKAQRLLVGAGGFPDATALAVLAPQ